MYCSSNFALLGEITKIIKFDRPPNLSYACNLHNQRVRILQKYEFKNFTLYDAQPLNIHKFSYLSSKHINLHS